MEHMKQAGQIDATPPSLYAIWAAGIPDSPLAGQSGYLAEDGRRLYFHERETAEQKIRDLQNRCVSGSPAAVYQCLTYPGEGLPDRSITAEGIGSYDLRPGFDPGEYQLQSREYGNTGGGCMVGTMSYLLPSLGRTVWVNCNDEGVTITSADYVWNDDHSGSWDRYEDVLLFTAEFIDTPPEDLGPWLPMVRDTLVYTAAQQTALGRSFKLPECWQNALEEQGQPPGPTMDAPC
mgnify:CR=1 FL=1